MQLTIHSPPIALAAVIPSAESPWALHQLVVKVTLRNAHVEKLHDAFRKPE
jgi:hypothetical protein